MKQASHRQHALFPCMFAAGILLAGCGGSDPDRTRAGNTLTAEREQPAASSTGPVYRFAKVSNGAYFYTGGEGEKDYILAGNADMRYEGPAFQQSLDGNGVPVYRFANLATGGYFYTANTQERDVVRQRRADMRYEGPIFTVAQPTDHGAQPVFRLANLGNGSYLYTQNAQEVSMAVSSGQWRDEGVAFHAQVALPPSDTAQECFNPALYQPGTVYTLAYDGEAPESVQVSGPELVNGTPVFWANPLRGSPLTRAGYVVYGNNVYLKRLDMVVEGYGVEVEFYHPAPSALFSATPGYKVARADGIVFGQAKGLGALSLRYMAHSTFVGFEDVTVAAGTFRNACKFEVSLQVPGYLTDAGFRWVARGSGVPVKVRTLAGTRSLSYGDIQGVPVRP